MKRHLKVLSFLLAGVLVLSSYGCSESDKGGKGDSSAVSEENDDKNESSDGEKSSKKKEKPRPQDNFYDYVNYDLLTNAEIPYGEEMLSGFEDEDNRDLIPDMVKEIGQSSEKFGKGTNEQLIHDVFNQFIEYKDDGSIYKSIMSDCEKILAADDIQELFKLWGELYRERGAKSIFRFSVMNDFKDASRNSLFIEPLSMFFDTSLEDINDKSSNCGAANDIARDMYRVMGDDYETADEKGKQMVYLALEIAHNTDFETDPTLENITKVPLSSFDEFDSIMSNLDGSAVDMFLGDAVKNTDGIYIFDSGQLKTINELITNENLDKWKSYLFASYLFDNRNYIHESNKILEDYYQESKETIEDQAAQLTMSMLPKQISEIYAERYYTPELDKGIHELFDDIINSYDELINKAEWLSADTRKALLKKLHSINLITAPEPHEVDPKDFELIGKDLYETSLNIHKRNIADSIKKLSEEVDINKPTMLATEVNAQYQICNSINITVAIMQKPMFDPEGDRAANLGALGAVIGHEIGHAFDSNCINYDPDGKYNPDWLGEEDKKILSERGDILADYYSKFTIMDVFHVDGELTKGENYADLSGVECVTNIIDDKEELKKLFESYAKSWATLAVDSSAIKYLDEDEHSPAETRVNAVLASNKKFNEVYDLKEGDGMYIAPEERVSRW